MDFKSFEKLKQKRILIVEDDPISSEFLNEVLVSKVNKLIFAESADDSVSACKNDPKIDLVLMDIRLPGKSGIEAIEEIKKIRKDLPIIAQTAYALEGDKEKIMASGCEEYIAKPIKTQDLLDKIMQFI